MKENDLLEKYQSAYKPCHSTETALLRIKNDVLQIIDGGHGCFFALLDLSAAFDTVDHSLFLNLIQNNLGIHGTALNLMKWYLS